MQQQPRPQAILWDNDGVLVETEPLYFEATRETLRAIDIELTRAVYQELSLRQGRSCFDVVPGITPTQLHQLRATRDRRYEQLLQRGVRSYDAVERTLAQLQEDFRMAVVTSTPRSHFRIVHDQHQLERFFEFVLTQEDTERHKPHPDPYLLAARRLQLEPQQCWVIEDTQRGFQAAARAKMPCVVIPHALTQDDKFDGAIAILDHVGELPALLKATSS